MAEVNKTMTQTKGFAALVSTAAILGTFGVLIRELAKSFSDSGQVFTRSFFATVIILLIVWYKKINVIKLDRENVKYLLIFCVVFPLSLLCFTVSANLMKVSNSLFMLYVGSLTTTAVLGKLIFKEKFGAKHIVALSLVLVGLGFFVQPFNPQSITLGLVFGLLAGIFEGASHTLRKLMKNIQREVVVFYQSISGVIFAAGLLFLSDQVFMTEFSLRAFLVALFFGLLLVTIGYLLVYGFTHFDVNWGTIILATELFFALVINSIFLHEYPTIYELIGGGLIFSGAIITSLKIKLPQRVVKKVI